MKLTRRNFLKFSGLAAAGAFLGSLPLLSGCKLDKLKGSKKITSICPFCSVGCGIMISVRGAKIINIEGDPEHPINKGKLCAKGSASFQLGEANKNRLTGVMYRAPYAAEWKEITWEEALRKIAENIKNTRDKTFIEYEGKNTVNRTAGIAVIAGAFLNNEEYYLLSKMSRLLGITNIGNESDFSHSAANAALSGTLGYGAMTNHWIDIQHADVILIIGSNPAENHPVSVRYILKAKDKGAKIIHTDPRYTRTSSIADYYVPLRPGTDIAFIGGMINYAFKNNRIQREFVLEYTDASYLINHDYRFRNGIFNGFKAGKYNNETWDYDRDKKGIPRTDKTLKDANTVFQIMSDHFSRYTPAVVSAVTGCPEETFLKIADIFTSTYKPEKAGSILCSSGSTQHTVGTQNIRAYTILQLLLGNIGIAGGGINAINQGANGQGAEDYCLHSNFLPGYLPAPITERHTALESYIKDITPLTNNPMSINILSRRNTQIINLLKSFYGNTASKENDFCFHWLPKISSPYFQKSIYRDMQKGIVRGAYFAGTNPVINFHLNNEINAMDNLEWMIVSDIFETETSAFWKRQGARSDKIKTEVFLLPAASGLEKDGSITNSGRWVQWRNKSANPPGQAKPDLWISDRIFTELKKIYTEDKNALFPDSILLANWDYTGFANEADALRVALEISGYEVSAKKPVSKFINLKDDGSTAAGNWLYCGSIGIAGNMMARRILKDSANKLGLFPGWAWCWPDNSRILYNRASVNRIGDPWAQKKWLMRWDDGWEGDVNNGEERSSPADKNPFIMLTEGVGKFFARDFADGPLPEHYEPVESTAANILNPVNNTPVIPSMTGHLQSSNTAYPYIATAYKTADEWQAGVPGKNIAWLSELVPGIYCEISSSLADLKGIRHGNKVQIKTRRGKISAYCLVTDRIQPFIINGRKTEMIGIIMNTGHENIINNISCLVHGIGDANSDVPEFKAFLADISKEA